MLNILKAIKLVSMVPVTNLVSFERANMPDESELEVSFTYSLSQPAQESQMHDARKLQFRVLAKEIGETQSPLKIEIVVDYIFEVSDRKAFESLEEDEIAEIAAHYCFLDIRRRFYNVMNNISLSGVKVPMSISELS